MCCKSLYYRSLSFAKMNTGCHLFNLNGLNLYGMAREPRKLCGSYVHKDQLSFYGLNDEEECEVFRHHCRFKKSTIKFLAQTLSEEIGPVVITNNVYTTEQQLCVALRFYVTGNFQEPLGDGEGGSQANMSRIVSRVSQVLAAHASDVIDFTVDGNILKQISSGFYAYSSKFCGKCNVRRYHCMV